MTASHNNSELTPFQCVCSVSYQQTNCHLQEFTQLTGMKLLILRFLEIFAS